MAKKIHYGMDNSVPGSEGNTNCGIPSGAKRMSVKNMSGGREFSLKSDLSEAAEEQMSHDTAGMRRYTKPRH